jgi:hypothetical protein
MKKVFLQLLIFPLLSCFLALPASAQKPAKHATIYFWLDKSYALNLNTRLALNNQRLPSFRKSELIEYHVFSSGRINLEVFKVDVPLFSQQFEIEPGKTYYFRMMPDGNLLSFNHRILQLDSVSASQYLTDPAYFTQKFVYEEDLKNPLVPNQSLSPK